VSPTVTSEQLTLDGLVYMLDFSGPRALQHKEAKKLCVLHALSSFQRTKDCPASRPFSPAAAPSNLLDFAPALFGGTFQAYVDFPDPVNPFFACCEKSLGDFLGQRDALDQEHHVNRVF
jgi:hypothetical protein